MMKSKAAVPYVIWMALFVVIPLFMIVFTPLPRRTVPSLFPTLSILTFMSVSLATPSGLPLSQRPSAF